VLGEAYAFSLRFSEPVVRYSFDYPHLLGVLDTTVCFNHGFSFARLGKFCSIVFDTTISSNRHVSKAKGLFSFPVPSVTYFRHGLYSSGSQVSGIDWMISILMSDRMPSLSLEVLRPSRMNAPSEHDNILASRMISMMNDSVPSVLTCVRRCGWTMR